MKFIIDTFIHSFFFFTSTARRSITNTQRRLDDTLEMPAKRKAPAANGRANKRVASGAGTPMSMVSDDDYDESEDFDEEIERQAPPKYDSEWFSASHCLLMIGC